MVKVKMPKPEPKKRWHPEWSHFWVALLASAIASCVASYHEVRLQSQAIGSQESKTVYVDKPYTVYIHDADPWRRKCRKAYAILRDRPNSFGAEAAFLVLDQ